MHSIEVRQQAEELVRSGISNKDVGIKLSISKDTVSSWRRRYGWDVSDSAGRVKLAVVTQMEDLLKIPVEDRTEKQWNALDRYIGYIERLDNVRSQNTYPIPFPDTSASQSQTFPVQSVHPNFDEEEKPQKKKRGRPKAGSKNVIDAEMIDALMEEFEKLCFKYQWDWWEVCHLDGRIILKSRQIGATFYFALEALMIALTTGKNQIFVSASKKQAAQFRRNIIRFVNRVCDLDLQGDPMRIKLPDHEVGEVYLYFLGTAVSSVQGYTGDLYGDESAWTRNFEDIQEVASAMALQAQYRETYFTTPSTMDHDFYKFWSGKTYNKDRPKDDQISIDISHENLKEGKMCDDGYWRQIVTIEDAIRKGCNLFNLDKVKRKYSLARYAMLCLCQFTDHTKSVFAYWQLFKAMVDVVAKWDDFDPLSARPLGELPVWIGYDPSGEGEDAAAIVVVAPPSKSYPKFRLIEAIRMDDADYDEQADQIIALTEKYNVQNIRIDNQGCGDGVYQKLYKLYPAITEAIRYSPESKAAMVVKMQTLLKRGLIEIDDVYLDEVMPAMLCIQRGSTRSGEQMTYTAARSEETGHADVAWAFFHGIQPAEFETLLDNPDAEEEDDGLGMLIF